MAAGLKAFGFEVDYFCCDAAPVLNSPYQLPKDDSSRINYLQDHGVSMIKYRVDIVNPARIRNPWVGTDFWERFCPKDYDLIQVAKPGPMEYPYLRIAAPIVEFLSLGTGVDRGANIVWSIHCSEWQRQRWCRLGGRHGRSSVISNSVAPPATRECLRKELGIPASGVVAGFHQRPDEFIVSPIPLEAFARIWRPERHFVLMGGGLAYRRQAKELGVRNIHFVSHSGEQVRISRFLNTLDFYAHGRADGETFGTVLAEAMMHGKACLTHFVEGGNNAQAETIGAAGVCVSGLDEYSTWLERLFSSGDTRTRFAKEAATTATRCFSEQRAVAKLASLYWSLVRNENVEVEEPKVVSQAPSVRSGRGPEQTRPTRVSHARIAALFAHPKLSMRNAARKSYYLWMRALVASRLKRHPFFLRRGPGTKARRSLGAR